MKLFMFFEFVYLIGFHFKIFCVGMYWNSRIDETISAVQIYVRIQLFDDLKVNFLLQIFRPELIVVLWDSLGLACTCQLSNLLKCIIHAQSSNHLSVVLHMHLYCVFNLNVCSTVYASLWAYFRYMCLSTKVALMAFIWIWLNLYEYIVNVLVHDAWVVLFRYIWPVA